MSVLFGATNSSQCEPCADGTFDFDFDPTTPCTVGTFTTSSLWAPDNFTVDIRANYTLGQTFVVEAPAVAMSNLYNRTVFTSELFVGAADDPQSTADGVDAIEFVLVFFRVNGSTRVLLNTTEAGATVLINSYTGQAIFNFTYETEGVEAQLRA